MSYATIAQLRALDGLDDVTAYPDSTLQDGIDFATELIDDYCGTSFEPKSFSVTVDGNGSDRLFVDVLFIQTITAITLDGIAMTGTIRAYDEGILLSVDAGLFTAGALVAVSGTAGFATVPKRIAWAARTIARDYALNLHSRIPSRALQLTNELGQIEVRAQAGGPNRPTNMPDVNAVLNSPQFKHKR